MFLCFLGMIEWRKCYGSGLPSCAAGLDQLPLPPPLPPPLPLPMLVVVAASSGPAAIYQIVPLGPAKRILDLWETTD